MTEVHSEGHSPQVTNTQFLTIYRFKPLGLHGQHKRGASGKEEKLLPIELVGVLPLKIDKESFWVSPSHLLTENFLQGKLYDDICDENIVKL